MATIALYANKINQMSGLITNIDKSIGSFKQELNTLKISSLKVNQSICDLSDVVSLVQASTQTQEEKTASLNEFQKNNEKFIEETVRIDSEVAELIKERKREFYSQYKYLQPECEKNGWDKFCDNCKKAGQWCKEHWKEIAATVVIVIGAVLAIAAVICSGGLALAPLLAAGLTALGVSAGTALSVATIVSLSVAGIALISTVASATLNIIDTWTDMSDNPTFKAWQTAMNWTSAISNLFYSVGAFYNAAQGITNKGLREFGRILRGKNSYVNQFSLSSNTSSFWSGLGKNGDIIARNAAQAAGKNTLEMTIEKAGVNMPQWNPEIPSTIEAWRNASASFAWNSSGNVTAYLGETVSKTSIWRTIEYPLLKINPSVKNIMDSSGLIIKYFKPSSLLNGLGNIAEIASTLANNYLHNH